MNEHELRALSYLEKAAGFRAMVSDFKDEFTRGALEKIAAGYEHLAKIQQRIAKAEIDSGIE